MSKNYCILKFAILAGSLIKKCGKFEFLGISGKLELVCQSLLNQAEMGLISINRQNLCVFCTFFTFSQKTLTNKAEQEITYGLFSWFIYLYDLFIYYNYNAL